MKNNLSHSQLRTFAVVIVLIGAVVSLGLTLYVGQNNQSILLIVLFSVWVLSPFTALLVANSISTRWLVRTRLTLYRLMLVISFGSLVSYCFTLNPAITKHAVIFLIVPLISWLLLVIIIPIAASLSRKQLDENDNF